MPEASREDRDLVQACLAGDAAAWERLWKRCLPYVAVVLRPWARRRGLHESDIDELCQDLFAKLWEERQRILGGFQGRSSLGQYLAVVAVRHAARVRQGGAAPLPANAPDPRPGPPERLEAAERAAQVREALKELPDRELLLIQLVYADGLAPAVVARMLGLDPGHARVLLHRVREKLRTTLGNRTL